MFVIIQKTVKSMGLLLCCLSSFIGLQARTHDTSPKNYDASLDRFFADFDANYSSILQAIDFNCSRIQQFQMQAKQDEGLIKDHKKQCTASTKQEQKVVLTDNATMCADLVRRLSANRTKVKEHQAEVLKKISTQMEQVQEYKVDGGRGQSLAYLNGEVQASASFGAFSEQSNLENNLKGTVGSLQKLNKEALQIVEETRERVASQAKRLEVANTKIDDNCENDKKFLRKNAAFVSSLQPNMQALENVFADQEKRIANLQPELERRHALFAEAQKHQAMSEGLKMVVNQQADQKEARSLQSNDAIGGSLEYEREREQMRNRYNTPAGAASISDNSAASRMPASIKYKDSVEEKTNRRDFNAVESLSIYHDAVF